MNALQAALFRGRSCSYTSEPKSVDIAEKPIPIAQAEPKKLLETAPPVEQEPQYVTVAAIRTLVCREYQITHAQMNSPQRGNKLVRPRHIAMYLATRLTVNSLPTLGRIFGGRDHTTILHARDSMAAKRLVDEGLNAELAIFERLLTRGQLTCL